MELFACEFVEMLQLHMFDHLYDKIVSLCTLLLLKNVNEQIESSTECVILEATLIDDNVYRVPILLDIWTLYIRYEREFLFRIFYFQSSIFQLKSIRYVSDETQLMYCKLWLTVRRTFPAIPRNPLHVLVDKLLKYTLGLVLQSHRSELFQSLAQEEFHSFLLLESNSNTKAPTHNEDLKLKQCGQEIVNRIKETMAKLDPKSEIVTSNECIKLVIYYEIKLTHRRIEINLYIFQMNAMSSFQLPASTHLLRILNDASLTSCLTDALSRSKTRNVEVLLSSVIRVIIWQKYMCSNSSVHIDYSDSFQVQKCYALELISLVQMAPSHIKIDVSIQMNLFQGTDELIQTRIKMVCKPTPNGYSQNVLACDSTNKLAYIQSIFEKGRLFGCASNESCLNPSVIFKRGFEQMLEDAKKLENTLVNNPQVSLGQFLPEIRFLSEFFNRLQNEI